MIPPKDLSFCFVVVFYNPTYEQQFYTQKLAAKHPVIAVDNSDTESSNHIEVPDGCYLSFGENMGIAYALNVGIRKAKEMGYEWVITLDQDSQLPEDYVNKIFQCALRFEDTGIAAPTFTGFSNTQRHLGTGYRKVASAMTSGSLININVYEKVGGFKDYLFIDLVDTDFCFNIRMHGYSIYQVKNLSLIHHLGNNGRSIYLFNRYLCSVTNHPPFRIYYMIRNLLWLTQTYRSVFPNECKFLTRRIWGIVLKIILFEKSKSAKLKAVLKGYRDYKHKKFGKLS